MTDNEIIKALKIHANRGDCGECAYGELPSCNCQMQMFKDCLDLINRQKAEIERLAAERNAMHQDVKAAEEYAWRLKTEKDALIRSYEACQAEAIKELVKKVKERKYQSTEWSHGEHPFVVEVDDIDDIVSEMISEQDDR